MYSQGRSQSGFVGEGGGGAGGGWHQLSSPNPPLNQKFLFSWTILDKPGIPYLT